MEYPEKENCQNSLKNQRLSAKKSILKVFSFVSKRVILGQFVSTWVTLTNRQKKALTS